MELNLNKFTADYEGYTSRFFDVQQYTFVKIREQTYLLLEEIARAKKELTQLKSLNVDEPLEKTAEGLIWIEIDKQINVLVRNNETAIQNIETEIVNIKDNVEREKRDAISSAKLSYDKLIEEKKKNMSHIYDRLKYVEDAKLDLYTFASNNDIVIELDSATYDLSKFDPIELGTILNETEIIVDLIRYGKNSKVANLVKYLYAPLWFNMTGDEIYDTITSVVYLIGLSAVILVLRPYSLAVLAIAILVYVTIMLFVATKNKEQLILAYYLACNTDIIANGIIGAYLTESIEAQSILQEIEDLEEEDTELKICELTDVLLVKKEKLLLEEDIVEADEYAKNYIKENSQLLELSMTRLYTTHKSRYLAYIQLYENKLKEAEEDLDRRIKEAKGVGEVMNSHNYMTNNLKVGAVRSGVDLVDYHTIELPNENILFTYKNETARFVALDKLKLFLANIICDVKQNSARLHIFDSNNNGVDLADFLDPTLDKLIYPYLNNGEEALVKLLQDMSSNVATLKQRHIDNVNKENEEIGKLTIDYNIIVVLGYTTSTYHTKAQIRSAIANSAQYGYKMLFLYPEAKLFRKAKLNDKGVVEYSEYPDFLVETLRAFPLVNSDGENRIRYKGAITEFGIPEKQVMPLETSPILGITTIQTIKNYIARNKVDILDYETKYRQIQIPDEKIWEYNTIKGIDLKFGYVDGDPSRPASIALGDKPVHALTAGQSGGGKSGLVNQTLMNLFNMYSPEWLSIVMVDFKNIEFAMYTDLKTNKALLPHIRVVAGTKDGDYAVSVFDWLMDEQSKRLKHIKKYKCQKIEDYNQILFNLKNKIPVKDAQGVTVDLDYIPRMLVPIDEFQVPFKQCSDEVVSRIKVQLASLAKEARAAGIHLWFISQSMAGTLDDDILEQFGLRVCLFLSEATSKEVLGNTAANTIKSLGWVYINAAGGNIAQNLLIRVPYAPNSYMNSRLRYLRKLGLDKGYKPSEADFFDENKRHDFKEQDRLFPFLKDKHDNMTNPNKVLMIGYPLILKNSVIPENFLLNKDKNENIVIISNNRESKLNILRNILYNIEQTTDSVILYNSTSKESSTILNLDTKLDAEQFNYVHDTKPETLLLSLYEMLKNRSVDKTIVYDKIYVVGIDWESAEGITSRNENYDLIQKYNELLTEGPSVGIAFITALTTAKDFKLNSLNYYAHKIFAECDTYTTDYATPQGRVLASLIPSQTAVYFDSNNRPTKFKIFTTDIDLSRISDKSIEITSVI